MHKFWGHFEYSNYNILELLKQVIQFLKVDTSKKCGIHTQWDATTLS